MKEISKHQIKIFDIVIPFVVFVMIITSGCQHPGQISPNWQNEEQKNLKVYANLGPEFRNLTLSVREVAALDEQTLLVGGSYLRSTGDPVRSVLLRSTDGGKTWQDTDVWLTGFNTWRIFVLDKKHAFAAVNYSIEGNLAPFVIFGTNDGGVTWHRSEQDLPFEHIGIPMGMDFSFASPEYGQFWIVGSFGVKHYYTTTDGGRTWKLSYVAENWPDGESFDCKYERDWENNRVLISLRSPHGPDKYKTVSILNTKYTLDEQGNIIPAALDDGIQ